MDELVGHCLRELSFDGDLGKFLVFWFDVDLKIWSPGIEPEP